MGETTAAPGSVNPGLVVPDTKITSMQVSDTQLKTGQTLPVKANGTGLDTQQCSTTISIAHKGNASNGSGIPADFTIVRVTDSPKGSLMVLLQ
nr:hypothetical protein [Rhodoferax sp.]